jgi:glucokinase
MVHRIGATPPEREDGCSRAEPQPVAAPGDVPSSDGPLFLGIDVGGTSIKLGLIDEVGQTRASVAIPTLPERPFRQAVKRMAGAIQDMLSTFGGNGAFLARAGLATPGPLDFSTGTLLEPGNLPAWHHTPIGAATSAEIGVPVTLANDASAAAYGEYWRGAGCSHRSMVMFTLGTGIGGGIISEGQLIQGTHGCGSELGHIIIDSSPDAPLNSLGVRGTLEGFCGAYAVVRRAEEALAAGDASSVRRRLEQGEPLTPLLLAQEAESGDQLSIDVVMDTARYLGLGIVSAVHTIDPESVVLGGAMTFGGPGHPLGELFLDRVRNEVRPRLIASIRDQVKIDFATLGSDAGYIGAAGLARRAHTP